MAKKEQKTTQTKPKKKPELCRRDKEADEDKQMRRGHHKGGRLVCRYLQRYVVPAGQVLADGCQGGLLNVSDTFVDVINWWIALALPWSLVTEEQEDGEEDEKSNNIVKNRNTSQTEGWGLKIGQMATQGQGQMTECGGRRRCGSEPGVENVNIVP